ncbi:hypothetical protein OF001_U620003 [Pseudomonas sp. OF001]|nr:hypothetical protein OF001_U620003 [Pseudomonas sp. OF001]
MPFGKWLALGFTLLPQILLNQRGRSFRHGDRVSDLQPRSNS